MAVYHYEDMKREADESNTATIYGELVDDQNPPVAVSSANITTATVTIYDEDGNLVQSSTNIIPNISVGGILEYIVPAATNVWQSSDTSKPFEYRICVINIVFTSGSDSHTIVRNGRYKVMNLEHLS